MPRPRPGWSRSCSRSDPGADRGARVRRRESGSGFVMVHCYCNLLILLIAAGKGAVAPAVRKEAMKTPYQAILTTEPGKRGGKPCIRGMRITVYDISYKLRTLPPCQGQRIWRIW